MSKTSIIILYGGKSGEHEVSKVSAASVIRNFNRDLFDLNLVGIDEDGTWHLQPDSLIDEVLAGSPISIISGQTVTGYPGKGLYVGDSPLKADLVFPVLHGTNGEDGTVQGFLEILGLPYSGSDILTSALGMDKIRSKEMWSNEGLPVVPYISYDKSEFDPLKCETLYHQWADELGSPFFVKPCRAGSSVGISKVKSADQLEAALKSAFQFDHRLLIETAINTREIECSVLGFEDVQSFPPGEVISHHEFYDYSGKYIDPDGATLQYPADLPEETSKAMQAHAVHAFKAIGGDGLARVDFFIDKDTGKIYLNEINTMPGFTSISMYPKMCETGGLSYQDLLTRMVQLGLERYERKQSLNLHFDV